MPDFESIYQTVLLIVLSCWLIPLIAIWVRYDQFPHNTYMMLAVFCWPLMLFDEVIRAFLDPTSWSMFAGLFQFVGLLLMTWMLLAIHKLTDEAPLSGTWKFYLPAVILLAAQIPFLLTSTDVREAHMTAPPIGDLLNNWYYYLPYFFLSFVLFAGALQALEWLRFYHQELSEQVVDVNFYRFDGLFTACAILSASGGVCLVLVLCAAFNVLAIPIWQTLVSLILSVSMFVVLLVLLERRRYAPSPLAALNWREQKFSEEYLRSALKSAEQAIIRHKAYKRLGLRLRQLADAAEVEPAALVNATHSILNRNFRAFIYHYRLEYAKKVLLRTDAKVSSVAKRLGFNSEKFLSDMFVRYIQLMGRDQPIDDHEL